MTSRTLLAQSASFGNTGGSASTVFGAVNIPAGSLCLVSFRSETSAIDITGTDTAGGTWTFVDANTSGQVNAVIGYSWNHPGGTGVVLTINSVLAGTSTPYSNSYRYGRVHVLSGGDTVDPYVGASLVTQATGPMDLTVNFTGAGSVLAVQSDYSSASYTPQNGGTLVGSSSYYGAILFTGVTNTANPKFNSTNGSCACIAVAFLDVPGGADISPPAATGPLSVSNSLPTSYRISGFSATDNVAVTGWRWRVNAGAWTEFTGTFFDVTGRTTNATDTIEVQARDAVPNWSNTLSKSVLVGAQIVTISALHFYPNGATNSNVALNMPGLPRTNHTFIWKSKRGRGAGEGSASQGNGYAAEAWHISRVGPWENDIAYAFGTHPYPAPTPGAYDTDGERTGVWSGVGPHYNEIAGLKNFGSTGRDYLSSPVSIVGSGNQASYLVDETDTVWVTNARQSYVLPDGLTLRHKYYVDLENDPTKVIIQDVSLASISEQDATQNDRGFSFGAPPWTESGSTNSETPRGKHYYFKAFTNGQMTVADMLSEAQSYSDSSVTAAGIASEHFSSINLTVSDITDKSGNGNHLTWRTVYRPLDYSEDVEVVDQTVYIDPAASSSGATVAAVTVSQTHTIAPAASSSGATVGAVSVVQTHAIAPAASSGGVTVAAVTVSQTHQIAPAASSSGATVGTVGISQTHLIAPSASSGGATVADVTVTPTVTVNPSASSSGATVSPVAFIQGFLGSTILSASGIGTNGPGIMHNDMRVGDDAKRYFFVITRAPTNGTLDIDPIGTFTYTGTSDSFDYELFEDGVSLGEATVTLSFSATEIAADPSNSGATVALVVVTQTNVIAPASSSSGASVASVVFGQTHVINPQPSSSGASVSEVNLTGATQINPEPSSSGANVSDVSLNQTHIITPAASSGGATAPTAVFTQTHVITVQASESGATVADVEFITGDITHIEIEPSSSGATVSLVVVEILEFSLADLRGDVLSVADPVSYLSVPDSATYLSIA